jgi:hypothetical protein
VGFDLLPVARTGEGNVALSQGRLVCRNAGLDEMEADIVKATNESTNSGTREEPKLSRKPNVLNIMIISDRSGVNRCCLMIVTVVLLVQWTCQTIVNRWTGCNCEKTKLQLSRNDSPYPSTMSLKGKAGHSLHIPSFQPMVR